MFIYINDIFQLGYSSSFTMTTLREARKRLHRLYIIDVSKLLFLYKSFLQFPSFQVSIRLLVVQKSGEHQLSLEVIIPLVTKVSKTCQVLVSRISGPSTVSESHLIFPNPLGHQHLLFWHNAWVPVPTPRHRKVTSRLGPKQKKKCDTVEAWNWT